MAELLKGKEVATAIIERSRADVERLKEKGFTPVLAIVRVGDRSDDVSYEKGAIKRCQQAGVEVKSVVLDQNIEPQQFYNVLDELNSDDSVSGILMFRPLPAHLGNEKARNYIAPQKDVDGCTDGSLSGVFTNSKTGFAPCTAQAAIEILDYYHIDPKGKNVAVLGRSLVVGKPVAMLLLNRNATVTICHTKTTDVRKVTSESDIIIACTGQMESIDHTYLSQGQVVIDVGINYNEKKEKLCGDCLFEDVEPLAAAITPVPGGVGSVTTSVLVDHTVQACKRQHGID